MNEEDKEFIKSLKTQCKGAREIFKDTCCQLPISYIEKIIDIVEKQQKEIGELKSKYLYDTMFDYISKDKIREKIKQFQDVKKLILKTEGGTEMKSITYDIIRNDYCEAMLKELLEE